MTENALRYSPPGKPPMLTASALGDRVELRVTDRGPGIPAKERDQVFVPFQRLGDTDNTTGVGLGLALSRGFTEAMGGTLTVEDTPGGGLTMAVSLPTVAQAPGPGPGEAEPGRRERDARSQTAGQRCRQPTGQPGGTVTRVLVVDDEPQILRALRINLRVRQYEMLTAAARSARSPSTISSASRSSTGCTSGPRGGTPKSNPHCSCPAAAPTCSSRSAPGSSMASSQVTSTAGTPASPEHQIPRGSRRSLPRFVAPLDAVHARYAGQLAAAAMLDADTRRAAAA